MAAGSLFLLKRDRQEFAGAIILARVDSANAGIVAADGQLEALGISTTGGVEWAAESVDIIRANQISRSFERGLFGRAQLTGKQRAVLARSRVARIAATESSNAFNLGLRSEARAVSTQLGIVLYRTWSAELDACPICHSFAGQRTRVGNPYGNGNEPGDVHPWCRCTEEIGT